MWAEANVNLSATRAPRQATHNTSGVAAEYVTGFPVNERFALGNDRIKIVVSSGGNVKTGTIHITLE